jgi:hypothetical protein
MTTKTRFQTIKHAGKTLDFFENPDHVIDIPIDHALLQDGHVYNKHQFSHVQELIERFFKIQREAGFCFD